jgi:hypothetical protein
MCGARAIDTFAKLRTVPTVDASDPKATDVPPLGLSRRMPR